MKVESIQSKSLQGMDFVMVCHILVMKVHGNADEFGYVDYCFKLLVLDSSYVYDI